MCCRNEKGPGKGAPKVHFCRIASLSSCRKRRRNKSEMPQTRRSSSLAFLAWVPLIAKDSQALIARETLHAAIFPFEGKPDLLPIS